MSIGSTDSDWSPRGGLFKPSSSPSPPFSSWWEASRKSLNETVSWNFEKTVLTVWHFPPDKELICFKLSNDKNLLFRWSLAHIAVRKTRNWICSVILFLIFRVTLIPKDFIKHTEQKSPATSMVNTLAKYCRITMFFYSYFVHKAIYKRILNVFYFPFGRRKITKKKQKQNPARFKYLFFLKPCSSPSSTYPPSCPIPVQLHEMSPRVLADPILQTSVHFLGSYT